MRTRVCVCVRCAYCTFIVSPFFSNSILCTVVLIQHMENAELLGRKRHRQVVVRLCRRVILQTTPAWQTCEISWTVRTLILRRKHPQSGIGELRRYREGVRKNHPTVRTGTIPRKLSRQCLCNQLVRAVAVKRSVHRPDQKNGPRTRLISSVVIPMGRRRLEVAVAKSKLAVIHQDKAPSLPGGHINPTVLLTTNCPLRIKGVTPHPARTPCTLSRYLTATAPTNRTVRKEEKYCPRNAALSPKIAQLVEQWELALWTVIRPIDCLVPVHVPIVPHSLFTLHRLGCAASDSCIVTPVLLVVRITVFQVVVQHLKSDVSLFIP